MKLLLKVLLFASLALCCMSVPLTESKTETPKVEQTKPQVDTTSTEKTSAQNEKSKIEPSVDKKDQVNTDSSKGESGSDESNSTSVSTILKHSKLFTEFVSFAVDPLKSVEKIKEGLLSDDFFYNTETGRNTSIHPSIIPSSSLLNDLFEHLLEKNLNGFVVTIDYANIKTVTKDKEETFKKPVSIQGMIPNEEKHKTLYFMADHEYALSKEVITKKSPKEQVEDFIKWKKDAIQQLAGASDDKLGEGTIGSLLGG